MENLTRLAGLKSEPAAMQIVSLFDAKIHLSRLVDQIATGTENEIVISRDSKPVARIVRRPG